MTLPGGPLHYATFDPTKDGNGEPPAFTTVTPTEGLGAWTVWSQGTLATTTSASTTLAAGASTVAAPAPVARAGFVAGTLTVALSGTSSNGADHAELIVSNDGGTVAVADMSSLIASHGGATPIGVTSGTSTSAPAASVYRVALRTWVGGSETTTARWTRAGAPDRPVDGHVGQRHAWSCPEPAASPHGARCRPGSRRLPRAFVHCGQRPVRERSACHPVARPARACCDASSVLVRLG